MCRSVTTGRCLRPASNVTVSSIRAPGCPMMSLHGLVRGDPRGWRGRGSKRGSLVGVGRGPRTRSPPRHICLHGSKDALALGSACASAAAGPWPRACFRPNEAGSRLVTGSNDGTARLWDTRTGRCLMVFEGHAQRLSCVCVGFFPGQHRATSSRCIYRIAHPSARAARRVCYGERPASRSGSGKICESMPWARPILVNGLPESEARDHPGGPGGAGVPPPQPHPRCPPRACMGHSACGV